MKPLRFWDNYKNKMIEQNKKYEKFNSIKKIFAGCMLIFLGICIFFVGLSIFHSIYFNFNKEKYTQEVLKLVYIIGIFTGGFIICTLFEGKDVIKQGIISFKKFRIKSDQTSNFEKKS